MRNEHQAWDGMYCQILSAQQAFAYGKGDGAWEETYQSAIYKFARVTIFLVLPSPFSLHVSIDVFVLHL